MLEFTLDDDICCMIIDVSPMRYKTLSISIAFLTKNM
jgi:hypothetical protein